MVTALPFPTGEETEGSFFLLVEEIRKRLGARGGAGKRPGMGGLSLGLWPAVPWASWPLFLLA